MKGLEKELDRLTSRLVSAMANRDSLEEVLVIIVSFKFFSSSIFCQIFISSAILINTRTYIGDQFAQEEEAVLCAGCNQRLLEPGLQADEGRFSQSICTSQIVGFLLLSSPNIDPSFCPIKY